MQQNLISGNITTAQINEAKTNITALKTTLDGILQNLLPEERLELAKMGDETLVFVGKCVDYASQNSNLVPSFIDVAEAKKDFDLASNLNELLQQLQPLCQSLEDTIMMAGSDSYQASLSFYGNVKLAAKNNVAGSTAIAQDLAQRFSGKARRVKAA